MNVTTTIIKPENKKIAKIIEQQRINNRKPHQQTNNNKQKHNIVIHSRFG